MKKVFILSVIFFSILPSFLSAQTLTSNPNCASFQNNFSYGAIDQNTNGEVSKLQKFLGLKQTGGFGNVTAYTLWSYQRTNGIISQKTKFNPKTTYFGPATRRKISSTCSTNTILPMPQTIPQQSSTVNNSVQTTQQTTNVNNSMQNDIAQSSLDFLIQDVCVNDLDQQIAGDPATCAKHRDLKFKEFIPYIRPNNILSVSNQTRADFPVQGNDGNYLVASPYDWGGAFSGYAFGDWDVNASDGGELIETKGEFSSYISTKDTSGSQEWVNQSCVADDPWGLFPMKMVKGENGNKIFQLSDDKCKTIKPKPTFWSYEKDPFTYTSGKKLYSIIVTHYEDEISKNPNIEVHYFTREYGLTRWESWQDSPNQDQSNTQNCSGPNKQTFNGHLKYRWACADWSYVNNLSLPINPLASHIGKQQGNLSSNLLLSSDFAQLQFVGWKGWDSTSGKTDYSVQLDPQTKNSYVSVGCFSGCDGNGIYQDVDTSQLRGNLTLHYGNVMKSSKPGSAAIALFMFDSSGNIIGKTSVQSGSLSDSWSHTGATFNWDFNAKPVAKIRFQIYIGDSSVLYSVDSNYLTPSY